MEASQLVNGYTLEELIASKVCSGGRYIRKRIALVYKIDGRIKRV